MADYANIFILNRQKWQVKMNNNMNVSTRIKDLGERIRLYRISLGITQQSLEEQSGVSQRSISRLEQGSSVQLDSLIKILSALNLDENLDILVPDQRKRPSFYLWEDDGVRKRASSKTTKVEKYVWGEDK